MRKLEALLLATLALCVMDILPLSSLLQKGLLAVVLSLQLGKEGQRWQLYLAYLAIASYFLDLPSLSSLWTRALLLLLCSLSALLSYEMALFSIRKPRGPFAIGTQTIECTDSDRPAWNLYSPSHAN